MLIIHNPSSNGIDIVEHGRRLSIKPGMRDQALPVEGEQAKALQARLAKGYPYLSFGPAEPVAAEPVAAEPVSVVEAEQVESELSEAEDAGSEPATDVKARPQHNAKRGK